MVTRHSTPWPARKPGYLPEAVWEHAQELRADPTLTAEDLAPVARLIGLNLAETWQGLARRVEGGLSWRLLLDLFRTSAPGAGFDPAIRDALRRTREILPRIAERAGELARLLEEAQSLGREHGISYPLEIEGLETWLSSAMGRAVELPERALRTLDPPALLEALAVAAGEHEPAPELPHQAHGTTRKLGLLTEWVRSIDTRYRAYYAPLLRPQGLTLTDTELAAVGSAVLRMEVKRESVKAAREDAPEPLPSDNVIPYRRKD